MQAPSPQPKPYTIEGRGVILSTSLVAKHRFLQEKPAGVYVRASIEMYKGEAFEGEIELELPPDSMMAVQSAFIEGRAVRISLTL